MCSRRSTLGARSRENNHSSSECRPMESQANRVKFGYSCSRRSMGCLMTQENGGMVSSQQPEVLVLRRPSWKPCVLVLRDSQQRYRGIIGVAVDDIAGGGDEVWEQAISKLKKRFTFGHLRGRTSSRWIHACWTTCLFQESGLCAPRKNEEGTIGGCKRN